MSWSRTAAGALKWPVRPVRPRPDGRIHAPPAEPAVVHARSYQRKAPRHPTAGRVRANPTHGNGLPMEAFEVKENAEYQLTYNGSKLYHSARDAGALDINVSLDTFRYLGKRIIEEAYSAYPDAQAAKRISKDVDVVFDVAHILGRIDNRIANWGFWATYAAGAVVPTIMDALRHLNTVRYPMRTPILDRIEEWATKDEDPRAIVLHAKILGRREQYQEALALMEKLMERIYPTKVRPVGRDDVTVRGLLEPPYQVYAWLKERVGDQKATDRVLKMAALEYQDPRALMTYADVMKLEGNMEMYEECMNKAAASGQVEACLRLANFYYLTSRGRFTPREQKSEALNTFGARISRFFGQSRTKNDFRKLALEWYELAFMHGSDIASLVLAVLLREDGESEQGLRFLQYADQTQKWPKAMARLRSNWDNPDFHFPIPDKLLEI
ncbi:hypothetical protein VTN77DRAFT_3372 [Rasamsonia byssochlamydoides]|uniref:uncharacterized protein n=1 Tax=Rasamsonia byssochlamydoides TaxID=89139 RepID=UPI0037436CF9